jgi:hypothetical protein
MNMIILRYSLVFAGVLDFFFIIFFPRLPLCNAAFNAMLSDLLAATSCVDFVIASDFLLLSSDVVGRFSRILGGGFVATGGRLAILTGLGGRGSDLALLARAALSAAFDAALACANRVRRSRLRASINAFCSRRCSSNGVSLPSVGNVAVIMCLVLLLVLASLLIIHLHSSSSIDNIVSSTSPFSLISSNRFIKAM